MVGYTDAILFHSIRHIECTFFGPERLYRNGGRAVIRACIGHRDDRMLRSQHIQQSGRDGVLVTMVGQLHDGARQKVVLLPAGRIDVSRQFH